MEMQIKLEDDGSWSASQEKKRRRLERKMVTQKERREKARIEGIQLREALKYLEMEFHRLQLKKKSRGNTLLSWKDVAMSLEIDTNDLKNEKSHLTIQIKQLQHVYNQLSKWTSSAGMLLTEPSMIYTATNLCLNHVSLHATGDTRKYGFDWLTQVLCQNADQMLEKHSFHHNGSLVKSYDNGILAATRVDMEGMDVVQLGVEANLNAPLSRAHEAIHKHLITQLSNTERFQGSASSIDLELSHEISPSLSYVRRHYIRGILRVQHILYRTFHDPSMKRIVIVGQNIPNDEAYQAPENLVNLKTMTWVVLDEISETCTKIRLLSLCSHIFHGINQSSRGPLERYDEAKAWGCDLSTCTTDDAKDLKFTKHLYGLMDDAIVAWCGYIDSSIKEINRFNLP